MAKTKKSNDEVADWTKIWIEQSQLFNKIANEYLKNFFEKNDYQHPDQHLDTINQWLDALNKQWQFSPFNEQLKSYEQYSKLMTDMMIKASRLLIDRWIAVAKTDQPVNNVRDLYDLWLTCCHDVYSEAMHTNAYQEVYGKLINQAVHFWKSMLQNK